MFRYLCAWLVYTWGGLHRYFGLKNSLRYEYETAVRYFSRAYRIDSTFRRARLERGILLWRELGRLDEATADFDALLAQDPSYGLALLNRALVAQERGRYQAALDDLEAYLRLPNNDEGYEAVAVRTAALLRGIVGEEEEEAD